MILVPALLRQFGVDPAAVLAAEGLAPDALDRPDGRMPFAAIARLLGTAAEFTGCAHFGLIVGQRTGLNQLGPVGELTRCSPTVGDALRTFVVHHHLNSRGGVVFLLAQGDKAVLGFSTYHPNTVGIEQHHDGVLAIMLNAMRELASPDWLPDEFMLAHSRPGDPAPTRKAFSRHLRFGAEFTGMRFPSSVLAQRVPSADPTRFAMIEAQVSAISHRSLVHDLRRALRIELLRGDASEDRAAQTLELHRRTLNRRLKQAGTTFQDVLDSVRRDGAMHYLQLTQLPLVDIAAALGSADVSTFTRAFTRWTGKPPGRARRAQRPLRGVPETGA
jgi:AraC-like DNA-binding protein